MPRYGALMDHFFRTVAGKGNVLVQAQCAVRIRGQVKADAEDRADFDFVKKQIDGQFQEIDGRGQLGPDREIRVLVLVPFRIDQLRGHEGYGALIVLERCADDAEHIGDGVVDMALDMHRHFVERRPDVINQVDAEKILAVQRHLQFDEVCHSHASGGRQIEIHPGVDFDIQAEVQFRRVDVKADFQLKIARIAADRAAQVGYVHVFGNINAGQDSPNLRNAPSGAQPVRRQHLLCARRVVPAGR